MASAPKRLLVVEDDDADARRLLQAFRAWGFAAERADTGAQALERQPGSFDLITLDILLPIINGKTVLETLTRLRVKTPVIVVTGAAAPDLQKDLVRHPAVKGWFYKPVDFAKLKEHMLRLIYGRRSRPDATHPTAAAMSVFSATTTNITNSRLLVRPDTERLAGAHRTVAPVGTQTTLLGGSRIRSRDEALMVTVTGGSAVLGTTAGEPAEAPPVRVTLSPYLIDKHPVTNAQYKRFLAWQQTASDPHAFCHRDEPSRKDHRPEPIHDVLWSKDRLPVVGVDWWDAYAYARWACDTVEANCLPTEAMWEVAAHGLDSRTYPWGEEPPDATRANFGRAVGHTTPVGQYKAGKSALGLYDMAGNVWEWCQDYYDEHFYRRLAGDAAACKNPICNGVSLYRVLRGGSWMNSADQVRSTFRGSSAPHKRYYHVGFRVALPALVL